MAGHMRDWLGKTVEREVKDAIQWQHARLEDTSPKDSPQARARLALSGLKVDPNSDLQLPQSQTSKKYSNDGSNIRISNGGEQGQYVQVLEFIDSKPPYPAVLSDATSNIKAKFSSTADEKFKKLNGRALSEETKGGLFILQNYEIVISLQTVQDQITLLVKEFVFKGCAGSPAFGRSTHIGKNTAVTTLVEELCSVHRNQSTDSDSIKAKSLRARPPVIDQRPPQPSQDSSTLAKSQFESQFESADKSQAIPEIALLSGINLQPPTVPRKAAVQSRPVVHENETERLLVILANGTEREIEPAPVAVANKSGSVLAASEKSGKMEEDTVTLQTTSDRKDPALSDGRSKEQVVIEKETLLLRHAYRHQNNFKFVRCFEGVEDVSEKQVELLGRSESWQHPPPGFVFPSPNVPISLLHELSQEAERLRGDGDAPVRAIHQETDQVCAEHVEASVSDSSEEEPIEWPPSSPVPPRFGEPAALPPDSSAEGVDITPKRKTKSTVSGSQGSSPTRSLKTVRGNDAKRGRPIDEGNPDDSSDIETGPPSALPRTAPRQQYSYQSRFSVPLPESPTPEPPTPAKASHKDRLFSGRSPTPRSSIPHATPQIAQSERASKQGKVNTSPSSDALIPATFRSDFAHQSAHPVVARTQIATITKAIPDATQASQSSLRDGELPPPKLSSLVPSNDNKAPHSGLKRKPSDMPAPDRSPKKAKNASRHDLGLNGASQNVLDPAVTAQQVRRAFMKDNKQNRPVDGEMRQVTQPVSDQHHAVQKIKSYDRGKDNSPSSYQPHQNELRILSTKTSTGSLALKFSRPALEESPMPQVSQQGSGSTIYTASGSTSNAPATFPSRPDHAKKISASSSLGQARLDSSEHQKLSETAVHDKFAKAYPIYTGNLKHFLGLCRMIRTDKSIHRSLWDDFIIRHKTDYVAYVSNCTEDGEEVMPYEQFYNERIEIPIYTLRIMDPDALTKALEGDQVANPTGTPQQGGLNSQRSSIMPVLGSRLQISPSDLPHEARTTQQSPPQSRQAGLHMVRTDDAHRPDEYRNAYTSSAQTRQYNDGRPSDDRFAQTPDRRSPPYRSRWPAQGDNQSKQEKPAGMSPQAARVGTNTHFSKVRDAHTRMQNVNMTGEDVRITAEVLDSIEISSDDTSRPTAGQRIALDREREQDVGVAHNQDETIESQREWWEEDDTPFKEFVRNFARLKANQGVLGVPGKNPLLVQKEIHLNVLDWHF